MPHASACLARGDALPFSQANAERFQIIDQINLKGRATYFVLLVSKKAEKKIEE